MANYEKEPISSILVLKIVGILALISVMLALPLIWLSEAKRAVERVAREVAHDADDERPATGDLEGSRTRCLELCHAAHGRWCDTDAECERSRGCVALLR